MKLVEWVEKARRVYTFGVGISAIFADLIAYTFNQIQKETHSLDEGHMPVEEKILAIRQDEHHHLFLVSSLIRKARSNSPGWPTSAGCGSWLSPTTNSRRWRRTRR